MKPKNLRTLRSPSHRASPRGTVPRGAVPRGTLRRQASRRGGQVLVYIALIMVLLLGVCAIVIDEGYWFYRKAEMQKATDAAAMAGAGALITGDENTASSRAKADALRYARLNGYDNAATNVTVTPTHDKVAKRFRVVIRSPYPTFFGSVFGVKKVDLVTAAEASYDRPSQVLIPITGGNYGVNTGPINIGLYGPEQVTNRGDLYSARFTTDDKGNIVENDDYRPEGYSFAVTLDSNFGATPATLQLYDADSFDSGIDTTAGNKTWDESGKQGYGPEGGEVVGSDGKKRKKGKKTKNNLTTVTRYTLYSDNGTPFDPSDDGTAIETIEIGEDKKYDKQWKDTFTWNPATYRASKPGVNFRLQVQTVAGGNENGFNVRVTRPGDTDDTFTNGGGNGSNVSAIGDLPVNFGRTGTGEVLLGYVPSGATEVRVDHFDSDVGVAKGDTIKYSYIDNNGGTSQIFPGNPLLGSAADNKTETDVIKLSNYTGGSWRANYSAGGGDNTTWKLTYDGPPTNTPGSIRLVR